MLCYSRLLTICYIELPQQEMIDAANKGFQGTEGEGTGRRQS